MLSYLSADAKATLVIAAMVGLSTVIRFVPEGRSHRSADGLKAMVSNTASVIRRDPGATDTAPPTAPKHSEIPIRQLVPGDLLALSAADIISADCRVIAARDLFISRAAMTGESLPVEKFADHRGESSEALEQSKLVFMGTNVVSGSATALVIATGQRTCFGALAAKVLAAAPETNAFQPGVNSVSWLLIRFALVMVPIVLLVNGFTKGNRTEAFLFAMSVAVALTPEMLPMIVTSTLAKGRCCSRARRSSSSGFMRSSTSAPWTCCAPPRPAP